MADEDKMTIDNIINKIYEETDEIGINTITIMLNYKINKLANSIIKEISIKDIDEKVVKRVCEKDRCESCPFTGNDLLSKYYLSFINDNNNYCMAKFKKLKKERLVKEVIDAIEEIFIEMMQDIRYSTITRCNSNGFEVDRDEEIEDRICNMERLKWYMGELDRVKKEMKKENSENRNNENENGNENGNKNKWRVEIVKYNSDGIVVIKFE